MKRICKQEHTKPRWEIITTQSQWTDFNLTVEPYLIGIGQPECCVRVLRMPGWYPEEKRVIINLGCGHSVRVGMGTHATIFRVLPVHKWLVARAGRGKPLVKRCMSFSFTFFLATPRNLQDLASSTKDWTWSFGSESINSQPPDLQGIPKEAYILRHSFLNLSVPMKCKILYTGNCQIQCYCENEIK